MVYEVRTYGHLMCIEKILLNNGVFTIYDALIEYVSVVRAKVATPT